MKQLKKTLLTLVALLALTTHAWAQTGENIFQYCYDCQRSPAYPTALTSATLSGFVNPYVSYSANPGTQGSTSAGPWKLEYMGLWSTTDKYGIDDVSYYQSTYNCTDVPVFRLYQWNATANEYQHAAYGVVCCYAKVSNAVEHTALFEAGGHYGCVLTNTSHSSSMNITFDEDLTTGLTTLIAAATPAASGTPVPLTWNKATKTGTFTMPGGNVTLEPEYYPQAALTEAPTAINDVPATTDGAIVKAGTVANIGSTETAQGTVMYYVSTTALDDAALLALAADQWKADVPTAKSLAQGQAYVYYYVRGNDSDTDEENFSDGDILAANALTVTIAAEPTKVTMAVNDKTMGTVEVCGQSKVEWTAATWKGWTSDIKEHTVDDITITGTQKTSIYELTSEDKYKNSLLFFVVKVWDNSTVTFSTTGDPFSRIEFTMIDDYSQYNPNIIPNDNWTVEGKSAVWEGEATKSLTLQSCSTQVSKITFFKGATPDGVTINGDGTFTVAKTATVTLKATPAEGYKFLYWEDDQTNTNPVREVTIESGMADMTYKAVFAEILYNVEFAEGTDPNEWSADPNTDVKKGQTVTVTYTGAKKVLGVKAEKKAAAPIYTMAKDAASDDIGKLICTDGHIHAYGEDAECTKDRVAMIAYVGNASDCSHGLAIALQDESGQMDWSTAGTTCSGKTPTVTDGTWRLPSIMDWQYMLIGCGHNGTANANIPNNSYMVATGLFAKLSAAGGDEFIYWIDGVRDANYWMSTENSGNTNQAWRMHFNSKDEAGFHNNTGKDENTINVRACLAF